MARMIPPICSEHTRSPGERELFEEFRDAPGTDDWVVLHSLDLTDHVERVAGEADFVVVVPELGVAVLEVKAHRRIEYRDGLWLMGSGRDPDERGPFKQATQAMHSLRDYVHQRVAEAHSVPFSAGAVFPYANFQGAPASPEWHDWQLIDAAELSARGLRACVVGLLRNARDHLAARVSWFDPSTATPDRELSDHIVGALRPNFEVHESPRQRLKRLEAEVLRYTEEQTRTLDLFAHNDRVLVDGPAGTGKTVLAIEAARRAAAAGGRVGLLCFNRLLGDHLAEEMDGSDVTVRTLHGYMRSITDCEPPTGGPTSEYWTTELPDLAAQVLLDRPNAPFDTLILDEAQDLSHPAYLDVLDLAVEGGLAEGRWMAFGDFENQAVFQPPGTPRFDDAVTARVPAIARLRLTENCRNTPSISALAQSLGRLRLPYSRVLRADTSVDAELRYHPDGGGPAVLASVLEELRSEGLAGPDTVILSPYRDGLVTDLPEPWRGRVEEAPRQAGGRIGWSTIQRFKGLEAAAVVVTDIRAVRSDGSRQLMYTACTRAKHRLVVLLPESEQPAMLEILTGGQPT